MVNSMVLRGGSLLVLGGLLLIACAAPVAPVVSPPVAPTATYELPAASPTAGPTATYELPTPVPAALPTFVALKPATEEAQVYRRVEFSLETDGVFVNPYDPAQADWWVTWTAPSGAQMRVPAFWYQDFDPQTQTPQGEPDWRVRFTPTEAGEWQAQAELIQSGLRSDVVKVSVAPNPGARGFVRINPKAPRYFAFDNGDFYLTVGVNMGWSTGDDVLGDYTRWLDRFSAEGGNLIRVWMASWGFGIEWADTGLGDYSKRMKQAWQLDQVFALAEARDVTIMLCLLNHGAFNERVNPEWENNPYNAALGGPLQAPEEFVTNPVAKELFKQRLRYIVARWGYSPALFAWEWWNEIHWTPITDTDLRPWLTEMTAYLRTLDPYNHLVTHSTANTAAIWNAPELQITQVHDYGGISPAWSFPAMFQVMQHIAPGKPMLPGEFGYSTQSSTAVEAIHLHTGLWAGPFSGYAGTGMPWWWDSIDPAGLWTEFGPVTTFFAGEDLTTLTPKAASVRGGIATGLLLQREDRVLGWVIHNKYTSKDAARVSGPYIPRAVENVQVTLNDLKDGDYMVSWFFPATGAWGDQAGVQVSEGTATLTIPILETDIAFKLTTL